MYSIFALCAFAVIYYAKHIVAGIIIALLPLSFLLWFLLDEQNLSNSYIEILDNNIIVVEYPFGRKSVKCFEFSQIDHTKLVRPYSSKLHGPRIYDIGIPYIVFYDKQEKQLFKLLAYPQAIQFQQSITRLINT